MYVMFPIGVMYYFGTNLDDRFSVPGFWPAPEECNTVPQDRAEVVAEYERIMASRRFRQSIAFEEERKRAQQLPKDTRAG